MKNTTDLWTKWRHHYKTLGIDSNLITEDGIIDANNFNTEERILFILKETNKFKGSSLSELLGQGPVYQMWHTLSRWAAGLVNDFPDYDSINNSTSKKNALKQIAVINLKKTTGSASSNMSKIEAFAHHDKELLLEQIADIHPKIIIACGTFMPLVWLLDLDIDPSKPFSKPAQSRLMETTVLPWKHPGRVNNMESYNDLGLLIDRIGH